jgi:hypothetical protein
MCVEAPQLLLCSVHPGDLTPSWGRAQHQVLKLGSAFCALPDLEGRGEI